MKQTKQTIKDSNLPFEEQLVISILALIIAYVEEKHGKPVGRLSKDDMFSNAYYMFQRLKNNAKKPLLGYFQ